MPKERLSDSRDSVKRRPARQSMNVCRWKRKGQRTIVIFIHRDLQVPSRLMITKGVTNGGYPHDACWFHPCVQGLCQSGGQQQAARSKPRSSPEEAGGADLLGEAPARILAGNTCTAGHSDNENIVKVLAALET